MPATVKSENRVGCNIYPGYVGVATYLTDNPKATPKRTAGIQKRHLATGLESDQSP